jgi:hypothetical protein
VSSIEGLKNFAVLTNHVLDTTWSFIVFGLGLLVISILVFVVYFRRTRWM